MMAKDESVVLEEEIDRPIAGKGVAMLVFGVAVGWLAAEFFSRTRRRAEPLHLVRAPAPAPAPTPPATHEESRLAWREVWDRPMKIDEEALDPLTAARMVDHNVRGSDEENGKKR